MKRVVCFSLALMLCFTCLFINSFAVDFPSDLKVNGMGFVESFSLINSSPHTYECVLVDSINTGYVEFIVVSDFKINNYDYMYINFKENGNTHYVDPHRSYIGSVSKDGRTLHLTRFWFNILDIAPSIDSFTLHLPNSALPLLYADIYAIWFGSGTLFSNYEVSGAYELQHGNINATFTFGGAPSQTYQATDDIFHLYIMPDQNIAKYNYDILEFSFMCSDVTLTSVSLAYGDKIIPVQYDNFINPDLSENLHIVRCSVDMSLIDRVSTSQLELVVAGTCVTGSVVYFGAFNIDGFVLNTLPDPEVSWLKRLWLSVTEGFNNVITALGGSSDAGAEFNDSMSDKLDQMEQANNTLNNLDKPSPGSVGDISSIVDSSSSQALSPVLSSMTGSSTLISVLLLVVTFMLVGFVLFGKK